MTVKKKLFQFCLSVFYFCHNKKKINVKPIVADLVLTCIIDIYFCLPHILTILVKFPP